jgi:DNA-directed RNA polymerase specialized sigma24 family protein
MTNNFSVASRLEEDRVVFDARFWRCYRMLHFIACRVLGGPERAEEAIENCWHTASRHPPQFEYEGEFRSWLLRVLIDEALTLLRGNRQTIEPKVSREPVPAEAFRASDVRCRVQDSNGRS